MSAPSGPARLVIAGVASGVGKTIISTGLMAALRARGMRVQAYKVGPDYIDPTYHRAATTRASYNLDSWLTSSALVRQRFEAGMRDADIAVIEGVMGLFDGRKQTPDTASTAEIARLLAAPVVLVVDVARMGQSVAAVVSGFQRLDPRVRLVGVILNKVASADHEATLRYALAEWTEVPVLGAIYKHSSLNLPARHLGLVPIPEVPLDVEALAAAIEHSIDVPALLRLAQLAGPLPLQAGASETSRLTDSSHFKVLLRLSPPLRIGLALDAAFSFYYPETFEALTQMGVEVLPFSPLADKRPPANTDLFYFGGGFPEVFVEQLAANHSMLAAIGVAIQNGTLVYAECGGYMYLGQNCIDAEHKIHALVGAVPYTFRMGGERAAIGYREITTLRETILGPAGLQLRGHEFHWSRIVEPLVGEHAAYQLEGRETIQEGYARQNLLASYVHVPLAAYPQVLANLLQCCALQRSPQP